MARKVKLGQHFLKSKAALGSILAASHVNEGSVVLEIGPGKGVLTSALLLSGARVTAIETDTELTALLKERFSEEITSGQLKLVNADIRNVSLDDYISEKYKVVANIPYYITGEIIRLFLSAEIQPESMTILVQKEVAQRIARSKKESVLSLSVKAYGEPRYVKTVPARYFTPPPEVDSAILYIGPISKKFFDTVSENTFFLVVKAGFANKRKKLLNNLAHIATKEKVSALLSKLNMKEDVRAEDVPLEKWKHLAQEIEMKE